MLRIVELRLCFRSHVTTDDSPVGAAVAPVASFRQSVAPDAAPAAGSRSLRVCATSLAVSSSSPCA